MPLAIVGMACRLPGADTLAEYWRLLIEGRSGISELPPQRLNPDLYFHPQKGIPGKSYTKLGGIVSERPLDPKLCPVPEELLGTAEASHMIMLEVAAAACRDANLDPFHMPVCNTGVYIGHARGSSLAGDLIYSTRIEELARHLHDIEPFDAWTAAVRDRVGQQLVARVRGQNRRREPDGRPDVTGSAAAWVIAQALGLYGPYQAIDAACASGLFAMAVAARALHSGEVEMAIVGGASYSSWFSLVLFSQAQALSASGSFPFDARADGFVSSDGYGAVLLKPLDRALADKDRIYAVVRGIGTASDGRGRSLWAPRKEGQLAAFLRAYTGDLDPAGLQYIEAHGTSTQLGDATEIESMTAALKDRVSPGRKIPIASVKANIGHTVETAGIAGLIKAVLAIQHAVVPPAINFERPNPEIDFEATPFYVPTRAQEWPATASGQARRAGVNSFGIGGLDAHVVVEEFGPAERVCVAVHGAGGGAGAAPEEEEEAVAVVGMGLVFPGARTVDEFRRLLEAGTGARRPAPPERWDPRLYYCDEPRRQFRSPTRFGGFIADFAYDWRRHKIPPKQLETADPLRYMLLDAADQAIEDAGYKDKPFDRKRTAVVVGTIISSDFFSDLSLALRLPGLESDLRRSLAANGVEGETADEVVAEFRAAFEKRNRTLYDETGSFSSSTLASSIARTLDLVGGAFTIDSGESSSLAALMAARDMLLSKDCDVVLCAGGQRHMGPDNYEWYALRGLLSCDAAPENGWFVLGEGAGLVMLKRLSDARRDNDPIRAIIRGVSAATDTASPSRALRAAAERAITGSGVPAGDAEVLETAGLPHAAELPAGSAPAPRKGRTVPLIGHTLGASGMASLIEGVLALDKQPGTTAVDISSYSFYGLACHAVLAPGAAAQTVRLTQPEAWRVVRLSAATVADLLDLAARAAPTATSMFETAPLSRFGPADLHRLAIVAESAESLRRKLALVAGGSMIQNGNRSALEEQGIFLGSTSRPSRVALLFPGQGSEYEGMLRDLVQASPEAAAKLREIDGILAGLVCPSFSEIAWRADGELAQDGWAGQVSLFLADVIVHAALTGLGIRPDLVAGHSYGEYPALLAAGVCTLEQAIRITDARARLIAAGERCRGVLVATTAGAETVERLISGIPGVLAAANFNAPDQTVFGGGREAVAELERRLAAEGFENRVLPVSTAFHTPLMAEVKAPLRRILDGELLRPPTVPLLSSVTNRYVADPLDIRDNLVEQCTRPVRYVELIRRLLDDGVNVFVEAGPRQVLTNLHRRIVPPDAVAIAADNPKRPGWEQLIRVRAALESVGALQDTQAGRAAQPVAAASSRALEPIIHFDATERRRMALRSRSEQAPTAERVSQPATAEAPKDEMEAFLVNFICEHTGYPVEAVHRDADLEADLGIDSLKKAQLFGELKERFGLQLQPNSRLSLDDYPTLGHVLEFLKTATAGRDTPVPAGPFAAAESAPRQESRSRPAGPRLLRVEGTHYEMGVQHARELRTEILRLMREFRELPEGQINDAYLRAVESPAASFTAAGLEELRGMAAELGCPIDELAAYNTAIVGRNVGAMAASAIGCAHGAVTARRNGSDGMIHAANEDWPLALRLGNALPRIVQVRRPATGNAYLLCGIPGQIGGLNGINAQGVAVTSAHLLDHPQPSNGAGGCFHTALVQTILENATGIDSALDLIREAPRTGAWSLCISHHVSDELCYVEYDGDDMPRVERKEAILATNHSRLGGGSEPVPPHSQFRLTRFRALLDEQEGTSWALDSVKAALRDRFDLEKGREAAHPTMNTLLRGDNQVSIVMQPSRGQIWVTPAPLSLNQADPYFKIDLRALFPAAPGPAAGPLADAAGRVMSRFVLRMREAPLEGGPSQPSWNGPALVVGDNPVAAALRNRLTQTGAQVLSLPRSETPEGAADELERLHLQQPILHLFLTQACDEDAARWLDEPDWLRRRDRGLLLPFRVCQRWIRLLAQSGPTHRASLAATTLLGGDFGFGGNVTAPEGGGMAGMLKSIRREFNSLCVKVIDSPAGEPPDSIAAAVCAELAARTPEVEVGYVRGRRRLVRAVLRGAAAIPGGDIEPGSVWVVTGGARGVTAIVARELGRRYGLKLFLLGSTSPEQADPEWVRLSPEALQERKLEVSRLAKSQGRNPAEAWAAIEKALEVRRRLQELADLGVDATYLRCDVTDRGALERALEEVRRRGGPIRGVVHGAGIEVACRYENKDFATVKATLATKVDAAAALIALTEQDPIGWFITFGSVNGRFGGHGQTDYSLASDMLSKQVQALRARRRECRAVNFDWPAWDEAGMSVRPESRLALEHAGYVFMPPLEGVDHLIDEIRAGTPEGEVIILDDARVIDLDRIMPSAAERTAWSEMQPLISGLPLVEGVKELGPARVVAEVRFDPARDPFLYEHQYQQFPVLPSVVGLEALAEAGSVLLRQRTAVLRDVEIATMFRFFSGRAHMAEVTATRAGNGIAVELRSPWFNRQGMLLDPSRPFLSGMVEETEALLAAPALAEPSGNWFDMAYLTREQAEQENLVVHGPRFRGLERFLLQPEQAWGRIVAPDADAIGDGRTGTWIVPAVVLDSCLVVCAVHARHHLGVKHLPSRFDRVQIGRLPAAGEVCTVQARFRERSGKATCYDFVLYGRCGEALLAVEGHRSSILPGREV